MYKCVYVQLWWMATGDACPASSLPSFGTSFGDLALPHSTQSPWESQSEQNDIIPKIVGFDSSFWWFWGDRPLFSQPYPGFHPSWDLAAHLALPFDVRPHFLQKQLKIIFFPKVSQRHFVAFNQIIQTDRMLLLGCHGGGNEYVTWEGKRDSSRCKTKKKRMKGTRTAQWLWVGHTEFVLSELLWERKRLHLSPFIFGLRSREANRGSTNCPMVCTLWLL